ncbi:MAG: ABC transporter permease [Haloglomus sp.]
MSTLSRQDSDSESRLNAVVDRIRDAVSIVTTGWMGTIGFVIIVLIVLLAVFAPFIAPYSPTAENFSAQYRSPSAAHPLGTDNHGRDVLSQIIFASRPAILIGITTSLGVTLLGTSIGVLAGYYGGYTDDLLMRLVDFTYGLPLLPFLIISVALFKPSMPIIVLSMILILWRGVARVIRSHVLTLKEKPYIKSIRASGASNGRIILYHIVPNVLPLTFLYGSFAIGWAILTSANLAFLGFGDPTVLSWGKMLLLARQNQVLLVGAWWWFFPPGVMIMLLVASVFAVGRAAESAINPEISEEAV